MQSYGKFLVLLGLVISAAGIFLMLFGQLPVIGKLPGDIRIRKENYELFIPITSGILISIIISAVIWVVSFFTKK
jgi:hypothetical protein